MPASQLLLLRVRRVACDAAHFRSSNHASRPGIHNLAHRSSLAPAEACELVPMAKRLLAPLIRRPRLSRYKHLNRSGNLSFPVAVPKLPFVTKLSDVGGCRHYETENHETPRAYSASASRRPVFDWLHNGVTTPKASTKNLQPYSPLFVTIHQLHRLAFLLVSSLQLGADGPRNSNSSVPPPRFDGF